MSEQKLVIVSNRLPVSVKKVKGKLTFASSTGGLATGLASIKEPKNKIWIGWPGISSDELSSSEKRIVTQELEKLDCVPVFLNDEQIKNFYHGYSNETIWPIFHYFTKYAEHDTKYWNAFEEVNEIFASVTKRYIDRNSSIWVHDYQLLLLPKILRDNHPNATIGFFLHIPFPSYEFFRTIPQREKILRGMLGADLIGFHTHDYVRHFLSSSLRVTGIEDHLGSFNINGRSIKVDSFPISIDYKRFSSAYKKSETKKEIKKLQKTYGNFDLILSVDRADYSKGIPERLAAFDKFLEKNTEYQGHVKMMMVAVPSRTEVDAYKELREEIEQTVSRINGKYGTLQWTPISYQFKAIPFEQLAALYSYANVALVTPLRDGMNLVAKEYVASQRKGNGMLVLSERAGAASELPEALLINPNSAGSVANALKTALEMPVEERKRRMNLMQNRIKKYDIARWANDFMEQMEKVKKHQQEMAKHHLTAANRNTILKAYKNAQRPLFLLDYDGTLSDFKSSPDAKSAKPSREVKKIINKLAGREKGKVVIISGRPRKILQSWFKKKTINLVAEHGGWIKDSTKWIKYVIPVSFASWKKDIKPIMEQFVDRTPGSMIEEKDYALVWHYRNASKSLAYVRKTELLQNLEQAVDGTKLGVFEGNKIIEVKPQDIHKGAVAEKMIKKGRHDFVLCIGDDYTDEDMFEAVEDSTVENKFTIKVGHDETRGMYRVNSVDQVIDLLKDLSEQKQK